MPRTSDPTYFCHHAVVHLDILGQEEELNKLDALPLPPDPAEFQALLDTTAKRVRRLRRYFADFFTEARRSATFVDWPTELRDLATHYPVNRPVVRSASDTMVVTVSLRRHGSSSAPNLLGLYQALVGSAGALMRFMHDGIMVRGGVDVGKVIEMLPIPGEPDTKDVYGAVLGRAYRLECKIAGYPRIVVGDTLLTMLGEVEDQPPADRDWEVARHLAGLCRKLLIGSSADGLKMLDFLGPELRKRGNVTLAQVVLIRDFVAAEQQRFAIEQNTKLMERYDHLLAYCNFSLSEVESEAASRS